MTAPPSRIEIRPVESKADRKAFIRVPFDLYRDDANWIAPLIVERQQHFDTAKNPYFEHARARQWLAVAGDRPVGRISAQICDLYLERYRDATGHFGFLEAPDDVGVFKALTDTACGWLAEHGLTRVIGPFSFSINDECGLLVDGFDTPPCLMMNHAPPYYGQRLEELGFAKVKDLYAYDYGRELELPRALASMVERARKAGDLELRPLRMSKLDEDLAIVIDIFNDAWADNWGFVPMTHAEVKALGDNLKLLVTGEYAAIASYKGEPAAMAITLPNVNDAIADLNGRVLPFGWA
ncbi:MAG: dATP pyrophosphohydrolase, partial [Hyphomicrobiales bacterium]